MKAGACHGTCEQILARSDRVAIRRMQDAPSDYQHMARWLSDERVLEYYEGRDNPYPYERVIAKFSPRALGADQVIPCFILLDNRPVGYIQYYPLEPDEARAYGLPAIPNIYGLDLFIGEPAYWNQGIGTHAVSSMRDYLFDRLQAAAAVLDPETWNTRAIRCYEKCGFRRARLLPKHELHEGEYRDSWLMVAANPASDVELPSIE